MTKQTWDPDIFQPFSTPDLFSAFPLTFVTSFAGLASWVVLHALTLQVEEALSHASLETRGRPFHLGGTHRRTWQNQASASSVWTVEVFLKWDSKIIRDETMFILNPFEAMVLGIHHFKGILKPTNKLKWPRSVRHVIFFSPEHCLVIKLATT